MRSGSRFVAVFYLLMMCIGCSCALGQATAVTGDRGTHGFDVVSIRVSKTGSDVVGLTPTQDGYDLTNVSLRKLIAIACRLREDQVSGLPGWARSARFDIVAKVTDPKVAGKPLTWSQRKDDLSAMLVDRFHLVKHTDTKVEHVFRLMLAPGKQKLKLSSPGGADANIESEDASHPRGDIILTDRFMRGTAVPMSLFTTNLELVLKRDVIDETGCAGLYDISLQWVPLAAPNPQPDDPDVSSALFTALREQLGLRLVASKGPVQILVVDHVEMPSAN
jgi:uncharacterized protein (TIGR03435 family)